MKLTYVKRTGHERYRLTKASNNSAATGRRKRALERLEAQLSVKEKYLSEIWDSKDGFKESQVKDIRRIKKEIETLKTRI